MKIPKITNLISQCFNSKCIEFAWQFDENDKLKEQFILQISRSSEIYMEWGIVDDSGYYTREQEFIKFKGRNLNFEKFLIDEREWKSKKFPPCYKNFTNGRDLVPLIKESIDYLLSI